MSDDIRLDLLRDAIADSELDGQTKDALADDLRYAQEINGADEPSLRGIKRLIISGIRRELLAHDRMATGWGDTFGGVPVELQAELNLSKITLGGVEYTSIPTGVSEPSWQYETVSGISSINVTNTLLDITGSGTVELTITGLQDGITVYTVIHSAASIEIDGCYWVGGPSYQPSRKNHYVIWSYDGGIFINSIMTTDLY